MSMRFVVAWCLRLPRRLNVLAAVNSAENIMGHAHVVGLEFHL